jgi:hypothetical protein
LCDKQQAEGEDMSDYGLTVAWGDNKVGREAAALELWGEAMANSEKRGLASYTEIVNSL